MRTLPASDDYRHVIKVTFMREGRPKYWEFHCVFCGAKIAELDGTIIHLQDVSNNAEDGPPVRIRCPGTKTWCRLWYEFQLYS